MAWRFKLHSNPPALRIDMPEFQINFVAIALAIIANFFLSFVWYTLLFRKSWAQEMGFDLNEKPEKTAMLKSMLL